MKSYKMKNVLRVIGDIFIPLLPGIICAGLCGGAVSLITQMVPHYQDNNVWAFIHQILSLINTSMMTYLTAWAGYRAAERFGGTPILGGMLGMLTSMSGINTIASILGLYNSEVPLESILYSGKGGVLAVIVGALLIANVEKAIRSVMPKSIDVVFTPLLTMRLCVTPYIVFIMPECFRTGRLRLSCRGLFPPAGGGGHASRVGGPVQRPAAGAWLRHALPRPRHGRRGTGGCGSRALEKGKKGRERRPLFRDCRRPAGGTSGRG